MSVLSVDIQPLEKLDDVSKATPMTHEQTVLSFILVGPPDAVDGSSVETKVVRNAKWPAGKWKTRRIALHSFNQSGDQKTDSKCAKGLIERVQKRVERDGYTAFQPQYDVGRCGGRSSEHQSNSTPYPSVA